MAQVVEQKLKDLNSNPSTSQREDNRRKETVKSRRTWKDSLQALKENNCQPKLLYPEKILFIIKEKIKTFHDKHDHIARTAEDTQNNVTHRRGR
jgi:hypothetical protein